MDALAMSSLKFGTSGLRGLVTELSDEVCFAYSTAFIKHMKAAHGIASDAVVLVGYDLRSSSPQMAAACMAAVKQAGMRVENCGPLPTPALALRAQTIKSPAIIVTGSHIPADRNGLKFYRADGEIDKVDEAGISALVDLANTPATIADANITVNSDAYNDYLKRCISILAPGTLTGLQIGIYQHSSVSRDLMVDLVQKLGAKAVPLGRSDVFVPVDTEALRPEDVAFAKQACVTNKLHALISTDGDADRPLVADENGTFFRGDMLGILTAKFLKADSVVTPVTSSSAVELSGLFNNVVRTRVGSPYVIEGMAKAVAAGARTVAGFEANGGVLLGSHVTLGSGLIEALPTRDAMLPILAVLGLAANAKVAVSKLLADMPERFTQSGRIEHVGADLTGPFLAGLMDKATREKHFLTAGVIASFDAIDGVRVVLATGDVVHYRASGNAPELRCYTESATLEQAVHMLKWGLERAQASLDGALC
jgi:phosphomannomutase